MIGIIKAFKILRNNRVEFENWQGANIGILFGFMIIIFIPYIIILIFFRFHDLSNTPWNIIRTVFFASWAFFWMYLYMLYGIKKLDLKLE